jgi:hypothetical protein
MSALRASLAGKDKAAGPKARTGKPGAAKPKVRSAR